MHPGLTPLCMLVSTFILSLGNIHGKGWVVYVKTQVVSIYTDGVGLVKDKSRFNRFSFVRH